MSTYVFPGQGSQHRGMGGSLFSQFPEIIKNTNHLLGYSIENLCLYDHDNQLNNTRYTQPALYVVNSLFYLKRMQSHPEPNYLAGHSLGEYVALFAAGVFDFETGLKLVKKRAELTSTISHGRMAAVIGLQNKDVQTILKQENLNVTIANYNSYTQTVISGTQEAIIAAKNAFDKMGAAYVPLKVSGAFHSSHMQKARDLFKVFLSSFNFQKPTIPVISNITGQPYQEDKIANQLSDQIIFPIQWTATIEYLLKENETDFIEIGPGTVLTGLIRRIKNGQ